jgi:tetratricopeptide (TPR) repeat protein
MNASAVLALLVLAPQDAPPLFEGLGGVHRAVTTSDPMAQKYFDQGLAFLFAFNHDEAKRAFRHAAKLDPDCSMAWWGLATANGPHINNPMVDPANAKEAWDALVMARRFLTDETQLEKDLVAAAGRRFSNDFAADRAPLDRAYAKAMEDLAKKYPNDADVGILHAEAKMTLHPWDLHKPDHSPQPWTQAIIKEVERVLKLAPKHPLALHLYIHAVEASDRPELAKGAADTLLGLMPDAGHMEHMPSHIYVRTGDWKKAIESNVLATGAEAAYMKRSPQQGFYLFYMMHNHQMLAFAAMMRGQSKLAIGGMDAALENIPREVLEAYAPILDGYLASIYEVRVRFGKWDQLLAMNDPGDKFPVMRTVRHMARAVAHSVQGDAKKARQEQWLFYDARSRVPEGTTIGNNLAADVLRVAELLMNGEILLGEGKTEAALAPLRRAVRAEDGLRYNEPPDWLQPTRHALGAVLIREKRFDEANRVYSADLARLPGNGWSLFGKAQAMRGLGMANYAKSLDSLFKGAWIDADTQIASSCLCVK